MVQKKKIISIMNLKHSNNKVVCKAANSIMASLRKEGEMESLLLSLRRLLRGLGGPKLRAGCFATLKWLIGTVPGHVSFNTYEKLVQKVLKSGSNDSKEKGDIAMAELLVYTIIVNTNYLKSYNSELRQFIAVKIMDIANQKSYLSYPAYRILSVLYSKHEMKEVPDEIMTNLKVLNTNCLDKLHFVLNLDPELQENVIKNMFRTKNCSLFDKNVMKEIVKLALNERIKYCDHPFYFLFVNIVTCDLNHVVILWEIITDMIKKKEISDNQLLLSFLTLLIRNIKNPNYIVSSIVGSEVVEVMSGMGKCRELKMFLNDLNRLLPNDRNDLRLVVIYKLLFQLNYFSIEEHSGTNFITQMMSKLSFNDIKSLAKQFQNFLSGNLKVNARNPTYREKSTGFRYYACLINSTEARNEIEWKCDQLKFIIDAGIFVGIVDNINDKLAETMLIGFYNAIGSIQPTFILYRQLLTVLLEHILTRLKEKRELRIQISEDELKAFFKSTECTLKKVKLNEDKLISAALCAEVVGLFVGINFFKEPEDYLTTFEEIEEIYSNLDGPWTDVLLRIIIQFMCESFAHGRAFAASIFKFSLKYFTGASLSGLAHLLYPRPGVSDSDSDDSDGEYGSSSDTDESAEIIPKKRRKISLKETFTQTDNQLATISSAQQTVPEQLIEQKLEPTADHDMMDVDEMDEQEKRRLDLVLQQASLNRKVPRTKKKESRTTHLQIRLLDFVEITCRQVLYVPFSYWLIIIPNLYRLFKEIEGIPSEASLHSKIRATLKKISSITFQRHYITASGQDATNLLVVVNLLLDDVTKGLPKQDKVIILNVCKSLIVQTNIYYRQNEFQNYANSFNMLVQYYLKQFYRDRKIIPVSFFTSLCESNWEGMKVIINTVGKFTFYSDVKINRRLLGFKIINAYFSNDYYFGPGGTDFNDLTQFIASFLYMDKDPMIYSKPECILKFIPTVRRFFRLLVNKNRSDVLDLGDFHAALQLLEMAAMKYREDRNLPKLTAPTLSSIKMEKRMKNFKPKCLRM